MQAQSDFLKTIYFIIKTTETLKNNTLNHFLSNTRHNPQHYIEYEKSSYLKKLSIREIMINT